ncbi:unnamed protein product [Closterium sp. Naga37s-1]|nr:unnamed protein product [Closterium sp. Naga37s-1]
MLYCTVCASEESESSCPEAHIPPSPPTLSPLPPLPPLTQVLYCTVCASEEESEPSDFVPLSVSYQERFSAGGRTSGGYFKREGRPKDHEILVSRLIDRPLRPMVAKGFNHEVQVLSWLFSYDGEHSPDALAITAAGAALAVSDIPLAGIVAGVRVGMVNGALVVNPTNQQLEGSPLDLVVAGTTDSVLMIEGYCNLLSEEQLLEAVAAGQQAISAICHSLHKWTQETEGVAKPKLTAAIHAPPADLLGRLEGLVGADLEAALRIEGKKQRGVAIKAVEEKVLGALTEAGQAATRQAAKEEDEEAELAEEEGLVVPPGDVDEGEVHVKGTGTGVGKGVRKGKGRAVVVEVAYDPLDVKKQLKELTSRIMRRIIVTVSAEMWQKRWHMTLWNVDVKKQLKELTSRIMRRIIVTVSAEGMMKSRDVAAMGGVSVTRVVAAMGGEPVTCAPSSPPVAFCHALAVTTLGGEDSAQRLDHLTATSELKRFYLQYTFPPSSVGETGRAGFTSRREVGHGALAERSLEPVLPDAAGFPYTVRVESTITESNGSSSMASVCGGCLAMLDAGVPLRAPVAGVAMGLILHTEQAGGDGTPVILTDILGSEDALGDMDFKVAGSAKGVTAFQMDIKVQGITIDVMRVALERAKQGRLHILGEMAKAHPPPSNCLSLYAPRCESIQVDPEKVNLIIGSGGKTIKSIIEESGVDSINIEDGGQLRIYARSEAALELARARIEGLTMVPEVGQIYRDCVVKTVVPYGAFVELKPGKEALIHVSELSTVRLNKPEDFVAVGDTLDVKILEINARGQLRLSHKAVLLEEGREPVPTSNASSTSTATPNGSSGENRNVAGAGKGGYAPPKFVKPNAPASPSPLVPKPRGR